MSRVRRHWPEYLMEAFGLGIFMISACLVTVLLNHPGSPVHRAVPAEARGALGGLAMGLTFVCIALSPWGKQSGAHLNPVVSLAFWRLGRVAGTDAAGYALAHFVGGLAGVATAWLLQPGPVSDPAVSFAATVPGPAGVGAAFAAEAAISFGMMTLVLNAAGHPRLGRYTPLLAGALVAVYITVEAPLSGMSMNPARTVASAVPSGMWDGWWIYFLAPPLGMLAAAEVYVRRASPAGCAKLHHENDRRCIHCGRPAPVQTREQAGAGPAPGRALPAHREGDTDAGGLPGVV